MLARALHCRAAAYAFPVIKNQLDEPVHSPRNILQVFSTFYRKLYNTVGKFSTLAPDELRWKIKQYVAETA